MYKLKYKFEEMLPVELENIIKGKSIVYLPVGSMEWHGPHMAMGMDTTHAYAIALGLAEKLGGVVMPPLYIGTESKRSSDTLKKIGFSGQEEIIGMDFPKNTIKSMYWPENLFRAIIKQQITFLCNMGFRTVIIVNGHGSDNQIRVLSELAELLSAELSSRVIAQFILFNDCGIGVGHAGLLETSVMQALIPNGVDLEQLPKKPQKLRNIDYAIVDSDTLDFGGNHDFTVIHDPRDANVQIGRKIIEYEINRCIEEIKTLLVDEC